MANISTEAREAYDSAMFQSQARALEIGSIPFQVAHPYLSAVGTAYDMGSGNAVGGITSAGISAVFPGPVAGPVGRAIGIVTSIVLNPDNE
jgi:hypothetical protein